MNDEQIRLAGTAFLAGTTMGEWKRRPATGYERPLMVHKVPRVPIRLDGDRVPPNTVQRFDGKPLYYVLEPA